MKKIFRSIAAGAIALLAAGQANAVTWGEPDGLDHPNVVWIFFEQAGSFFTCTGTLLSPTVVLTAGHCLEEGDVVNDNTWVTNDPGPWFIGSDIAATGCDFSLACIRDFFDNDPRWTAGAANPHPQFADYAEFPDTYDVGVIELNAPIVVSEYGVLPELNELDHLKNKKGAPSTRQARVVGFGSEGTIPAFADPPGSERVAGTVTMENIKNSITGSQSIQLSNNPGNGNGVGGTCFGDSGGPAFLIDPDTGDETNVVGSVTSFGFSGQCAGRDFNFRMDIQTAQDFVNGFLD